MDARDPLSRTDTFGKTQRSAIMRSVKSRDTKPELVVRRLLTGLGLRYRLHRTDLPGSPDLALGPRKIAVFVHGCFWHGHDCKRGAREPKANADYWRMKIRRNRERDARTAEALKARGWRAVVVWECELRPLEVLRARLATETGSAAGGAEPTLPS